MLYESLTGEVSIAIAATICISVIYLIIFQRDENNQIKEEKIKTFNIIGAICVLTLLITWVYENKKIIEDQRDSQNKSSEVQGS